MKNPTVVVHDVKDLRLEDREIKKPGPHEVQLEMKAVGICGSDVHYWQHGRIGDFVVRSPMVIGHEPSGVVTEVGSAVTHLKVGDRVAIEPGVPCLRCAQCKTGNYNLCADVRFCATPPVDGCLQRYYCHDAAFCHRIPDSVSHEEAALVEPLSVGVYACRRGGVTLGASVLICGAGPIGLVNLLVARAMGASKIVVTDLVESKLVMALRMGATHTINSTGLGQGDMAVRVKEAIGAQCDITIECTGVEGSVRAAVSSTRSGGVVVCVGMGKPDINFPMLEATWRQVDIRGVFRYCNTYPTAINMIASKVVDVTPLITHRFALEDALEAFEVCRSGRDGAIKVMITMP